MPKSKEYWKKRFETLENMTNSYGQETFKQIEPAFDKALRDIEGQIQAWYGRIAINNKVSIEETRKLLTVNELKEFKWDVKEYIKYGQENALNGKWMKELENASAKFHISRLEALKIRTQQAAEVAFGNELDAVDMMARKVFTKSYYHTIYELQKGFNIGFNIGEIDERQLGKLIVKPWAADGKNFSKRIWKSRGQLVNELHAQLTRTCLLEKSPNDAINTISKKFKVSKNQAGRLVMTEQAYFRSVAQQQAFKDLDVERFEVVATLDSLTSPICQDMDGKVFDMKDYQIGVTVPPFHPNCRSTTAPYFDDDDGERIARDEEGKTYYVPSNIKYDEWYEKFVIPASDKKEYEKYTTIITNLSFEKFKKIKYNSSEKYQQIQREYKTINEVNNKEWNDSFKEKAKLLYYNFRDEGFECSSHFLARYLNRKDDFTFEEVIDVLRKSINYEEIEKGHNIRFYNSLRIVTNKDDTELITVVKNKEDIIFRNIDQKKWRKK